MTPSAIAMQPTQRKSGIPKKGAASRQREIHQGAKPATNPGAMTRKTAEPTIANAFLIILNLITSPDTLWFYWVTLGWGVGLVAHALQVYGSFTVFGRDWEDRKIKQYMDRDQP